MDLVTAIRNRIKMKIAIDEKDKPAFRPSCWKRRGMMKPYNPNAKCPKCGYCDISSVYRDKGEGSVSSGEYYKPERIKRECRRCHYEWDEKPLSKKGKG
jgi:hypothetical protein